MDSVRILTEMETLKENQPEILELNNTTVKLENLLEGFSSRLDQVE